MDLGIKGRTAIVCASSRGLGKACATALAAEGVTVVINGLNEERLEASAEEIRQASGSNVIAVQANINTVDGRRTLLSAAPQADILINNNAGPEPGNFMNYGYEQWNQALEAHFLSAFFMIQALLPGMRERRFGRIINIASALVKSPRSPQMTLSIATRTALIAACKAISRDVVADNVTINNILPERIDTDRQRFMAERMVKESDISVEEAYRRIADTLPAKRLGRPEEFGAACAFLRGAQAGFINGQHLQLDGGGYSGLI